MDDHKGGGRVVHTDSKGLFKSTWIFYKSKWE